MERVLVNPSCNKEVVLEVFLLNGVLNYFRCFIIVFHNKKKCIIPFN